MKASISLIKRYVADGFGVPVASLSDPSRLRKYARPRQVAMYFGRKMTVLSTAGIGRAFGGRDHTTVMHSVKKVAELMAQDPDFRRQVEDVRSGIEAALEDAELAEIDLRNLQGDDRRAALRQVKRTPGGRAIGSYRQMLHDLNREFGEKLVHGAADAFGSEIKFLVSENGTWSMLSLFTSDGLNARLVTFGEGWKDFGRGLGVKRLTTPAARNEVKKRPCNMCQETFLSRHYGERTCPKCKLTKEWRNPGDARFAEARV